MDRQDRKLFETAVGTTEAPFSPLSLDPAGVNDDPLEVGFTAMQRPAEHRPEHSPVAEAAKQVANVLKRSSERLSDARDQAVAVGQRNPVTTTLTLFAVGIGCGIGGSLLFSNWITARRRQHLAATAASINDPSSQIPVNVSVGSRCG